MFRTLLTVLASGAVVAAVAVPASASTLQNTVIENFASSVQTVAYEQPVTFTGELVTITTLGTRTPVPDEPVQIQLQPPGQGGFVPVASGTTDAGGQFTITTTLPSGGPVRAAFAGDTGLGLAPGYSDPAFGIVLDVTHLSSRLVLDPVPGSVPAGTPVTFSGTMQVQVNGAWQPYADAPITFTMEPYTSSQPNVRYVTTTDAEGRFTLTEPLSETSDWSVDDSLNDYYWAQWYPDWAGGDYGWIEGVSRTRVTGFSLPAKEEAHYAWTHGLYATGTVQRWNGSAWTGLAYGMVQFYYQRKGSTTWHKDGGTQVGANGGFHAMVGIHLGTANWQVRVTPAADTLASHSTNTVTSTITDRTHFAYADIQRHSSWSSINGQVTDWYNGQPTFSTLRGLKLLLYYEHKGSTTWHYYKTEKVGTNGFFSFSEAKSYGYYFKVHLPAQGPFLPSTSHTL